MRYIVDWILRIAIALILFQTLFFKFLGAEESIYIFSTLGVEPWGRYLTGFAELISVILLLISQTTICGALLSMSVIAGAIVAHLTKLGIAVQGDGGLLFGLAVAVFIGSGILLLLRKEEIVTWWRSCCIKWKSGSE